MNHIPKDLAAEIREKMSLVRDPHKSVFREEIFHVCDLIYQKRKRKAIEENAQIHSF